MRAGLDGGVRPRPAGGPAAGLPQGQGAAHARQLHFADDVRQAVAEALIPVVYRQAVDEAQLEPVEEPDFQELKLEEGAPLRFTAVVEIKPAIALGEYRGRRRSSTRPGRSTDADVDDDARRSSREQQATLVTVDAPGRASATS